MESRWTAGLGVLSGAKMSTAIFDKPRKPTVASRDEQHLGCERSPRGNSVIIHCANSDMTHGMQGNQSRDPTDMRMRLCCAGAVGSHDLRGTTRAREPGRSRAGRPLIARRKGCALLSTALGVLGRSQKGEKDALRRRDLGGSEEGGEASRTPGSPHGGKIVF